MLADEHHAHPGRRNGAEYAAHEAVDPVGLIDEVVAAEALGQGQRHVEALADAHRMLEHEREPPARGIGGRGHLLPDLAVGIAALDTGRDLQRDPGLLAPFLAQ